MRIGTLRGALLELQLPDDELYKAISEAGFDSIDYSLMNGYTNPLWQLSDEKLRMEMETVKMVIHKNGLIVGQTHAPIDMDWVTCPETKEARWNALVQAIKATSYLGAPYIVIHPLTPPGKIRNKGYYEYAKELNMEFFRFLEPYLKEYNVKAAIENLFTNDSVLMRTDKTSCSSADDLLDYLETLNSDRFVVCLDVGHAALAGQDPVDMIYKLGKKYLHVTHIHDNDHINDDHYMPGIGKNDWLSIGRALNDIGYEDVFSYEANRTFQRIAPYAKELSIEFLKLYAALAKAITNAK